MIGKVQQDSFQSLRIQIEPQGGQSDQFGFGLGSPDSALGESLSSDRDCPVGSGRPGQHRGPHSARSPASPPVQQTSRYKTEMCRPFQENGTCKYGEKCQFAHGVQEVRNISRHPKYKTDMCRTYHSVGFCPYGPRCHFVHALDEARNSPVATPEKKCSGPVKQLPMFGGNSGSSDTWGFSSPTNTPVTDNLKPEMSSAVAQLNKYFNMSGGRPILSSDSSRSGSFCSDGDSLPSSSPPPDSFCTSPNDVSRNLRLPIFNRIGHH